MKRFLIYISQEYSIPIGRPLQAEIIGRGYQVKWFCDEVKTLNSFGSKEKLLRSVDEVMHYNPDCILTATNVVPDFFPGIKVQIFHGFSVGKRSESKGHFNIRGFFDLYCTQGLTTTAPFKKLQKKHKYFEVVETGWSKVDPLFPLEKKCISEIPTVLISSTFTPRLSLAKNPSILKEIQRLAQTGKWQFIAVLHPKMEQEIVDKFKSFENQYFSFYETTDLIPLFKKADIMLSDTTSAITEFLLQHKPVVTINNNNPASHMINISSADKIEEALEYAITRPNNIMKAIENFIEVTHPYSDGKSSKRVIDACLDFFENGKIRRKPLNLIRRYKIRKKLKQMKV